MRRHALVPCGEARIHRELPPLEHLDPLRMRERRVVSEIHRRSILGLGVVCPVRYEFVFLHLLRRHPVGRDQDLGARRLGRGGRGVVTLSLFTR